MKEARGGAWAPAPEYSDLHCGTRRALFAAATVVDLNSLLMRGLVVVTVRRQNASRGIRQRQQ